MKSGNNYINKLGRRMGRQSNSLLRDQRKSREHEESQDTGQVERKSRESEKTHQEAEAKSVDSLVIVELRNLLASCLRSLFQAENCFETILIARDPVEAVKRAEPHRDHIFLLSGLSFVSMKRGAAKIASVFPTSRIIFLDEQPRHMGGLAACMTQSHGYWTLCDSPAHLIAGVAEVAAGAYSLSPTADHLLCCTDEALVPRNDLPSFGIHLLTDRELECFEHLVRYRTLDYCAKNMGICNKTAENFKYRIMKKLNVRSLADLVHFAFCHGLVD